MNDTHPPEPPPEPQEGSLKPAPGVRMGFALGLSGLLVFWLTFYNLITHSHWHFIREWGLMVAFGLGLMALASNVWARAAARRESHRFPAPGTKGSGCLVAACLGSVVAGGVIYLLIFGGSRTHAIEKYMMSNVQLVSHELAGTLDELKHSPALRNPGLPKTPYPDSAEGTLQRAQDAVQFVMSRPVIQEAGHPYRTGPAFLVGPAGHQPGTVYVDLSAAGKPLARNPVVTVTGVYKGRMGLEEHHVKRVQVQP